MGKETYIGNYTLGSLSVDVYLRSGRGAEFWFQPEPGYCPRIRIGADGNWYEVLTRIIHEVTEFSFSMRSCRFTPDELSQDATSFRFFADHVQFSAVCDDVAFFLSKAEADIKKEWRKR